MSFVVRCLAIAHHSHNVREYYSGPAVLVGVEEYAQPLETICRAEDWSGCGALLGEPHGHAICMEVSLAMDFEFNLDL